MKPKYLDLRNCRALLGKACDATTLRDFDNYLVELNSESSYRGIVDKLIQRNQQTHSEQNCWRRLLRFDIDVCLELNFQSGQRKLSINDYTVSTELSRRGIGQRVVAQISHIYPNGTRWTYKVPLQTLLKGWGNANKGYQGYVHTITYGHIVNAANRTDAQGNKVKEMHYVGVTSRDWLKRLDEHMSDVRRGKGKLFHHAWRESLTKSNVVYNSELMLLNTSKEFTMNWEEEAVDKWSLAPKGFNMIPGGLKGLKYLHKLKLVDRTDVSLENRDRAIAEYVRRNPRKGIPNPFMSDLWEDDEFYLRVVEAKTKWLSPDQVRKIRELADKGWFVPEIAEEVRALNETQVRNVIAGRTYTRIH